MRCSAANELFAAAKKNADGQWKKEASGFQLGAYTDKAVHRGDEPIRVTLTLRNTSNKDLRLPDRPPTTVDQFLVQSPRKVDAPRPLFGA